MLHGCSPAANGFPCVNKCTVRAGSVARAHAYVVRRQCRNAAANAMASDKEGLPGKAWLYEKLA